MDAAYWEDLAGRLYGLLIMLEDRLGSEQAELFHEFIAVGEYGLALEEIAGALAQDKIPITDQERGDMLALAARMKMDNLVPHALGFWPAGPLTGHKPGVRSSIGPRNGTTGAISLQSVSSEGTGLDLGCCGGDLPAGEVVRGGSLIEHFPGTASAEVRYRPVHSYLLRRFKLYAPQLQRMLSSFPGRPTT
jgi:hypothetical protein